LSANVTERMLHEYWLAHFRDAIAEGKACSIMASYNQINGVHNVHNRPLLTDILKGEWGFTGFVVSDLGGVHDRNMVVKSINAGCDFSDKQFMQFIPAAVRDGQISEARLNEALARVLRVRFRLGEFDPADQVPWRTIPMSVVCSAEHHALSLQASRESIVLLKNGDNLLPLDPGKLKRVAVVGPMAEKVYEGDSNYVGAPGRIMVGILQGLTESLPGAEVVYARGAQVSPAGGGKNGRAIPFDEAGELQKAVAAARGADAAIVCVGTDGSIEREGHDRTTLALPGNQEQLVEAVAAVNPRTVVVLVNAGSLTIPWIASHVPAIVSAWWSGEAQGQAVADVLLGKFNPGGHLPYTVYASAAQVPPQDEYDISRGFTYMYVKGAPLFPFGHGLSYTSFAFSNLHLSQSSAKDGETITATLQLANTGSREGSIVVEMYAHEPAGKVVKPAVRLVGFKRVELKAGEKAMVSIPVEVARMRYWDETVHAFVAEPGVYELKAGSNSADLPVSASFSVKSSSGEAR
jgi:beta-glucosidase